MDHYKFMTQILFPKPKTIKPTQYEKFKAKMLKDKEIRAKYLTLRRKKPILRKKRVRLPKLPKIKNLEARLKKVMYPYIKKRDGNICISCGKKNLIGNDWHAGHYIKAELCNMVIRYDEWNINSQCSHCNKWLRGNTIAYRNAMLDKYGTKAVEELDNKYNKSLPLNFNEREWLLQKIAEYKDVSK